MKIDPVVMKIEVVHRAADPTAAAKKAALKVRRAACVFRDAITAAKRMGLRVEIVVLDLVKGENSFVDVGSVEVGKVEARIAL